MNDKKSNSGLDLCDDHVKCLFSEFINEKKRSNKISTRMLFERVSFKQKTISRYLGGNELPICIPQDTYIQFIQALETSDEEFLRYISEHPRNLDEVRPNSDFEAPKPSESSSDSKVSQHLPLVPESPQIADPTQSNCDFKMSEPSESKFSDSPPSITSNRFTRIFVYLSLLALPLVLSIAFLDWKDQTSYFELGIMAKKHGQQSEAIDYFKQAIEKNDKRADTYYELADIHADLTDNNRAIENYRKGIAEDTKFSSRAYNNLALLLLSQDDINNALVQLDRAQQNIITPIEKERWAQSGIILKNRAWAYWKMELYTEAMKFIIQAQEQLGPAQMLDLFPEVFCLHALIAKHTGNDPDAAEQLCIDRFEAYQAKQQSGAFGNTIKPIHGMTYELYLLVLKQHGNR